MYKLTIRKGFPKERIALSDVRLRHAVKSSRHNNIVLGKIL